MEGEFTQSILCLFYTKNPEYKSHTFDWDTDLTVETEAKKTNHLVSMLQEK